MVTCNIKNKNIVCNARSNKPYVKPNTGIMH